MQNDIELVQSDIKLIKRILGVVLACVVVQLVKSLPE